MRSLHDYTVVLRPDDNGTFVAYVPAIAGCHAWGATWEEAQQELANVFEMIRDEYLEAGRSLPQNVELVKTSFSDCVRFEIVSEDYSALRLLKTVEARGCPRLNRPED